MKSTSDGSLFPSTLLTASILLAQIDVQGLADYALRASIGGALWLGYKIVADRFERYRKPQGANGHS